MLYRRGEITRWMGMEIQGEEGDLHLCLFDAHLDTVELL
jgi:hypothetical protein